MLTVNGEKAYLDIDMLRESIRIGGTDMVYVNRSYLLTLLQCSAKTVRFQYSGYEMFEKPIYKLIEDTIITKDGHGLVLS